MFSLPNLHFTPPPPKLGPPNRWHQSSHSVKPSGPNSGYIGKSIGPGKWAFVIHTETVVSCILLPLLVSPINRSPVSYSLLIEFPAQPRVQGLCVLVGWKHFNHSFFAEFKFFLFPDLISPYPGPRSLQRPSPGARGSASLFSPTSLHMLPPNPRFSHVSHLAMPAHNAFLTYRFSFGTYRRCPRVSQ